MTRNLSEYEVAQIIYGQSYEEENPHWCLGQKNLLMNF